MDTLLKVQVCHVSGAARLSDGLSMSHCRHAGARQELRRAPGLQLPGSVPHTRYTSARTLMGSWLPSFCNHPGFCAPVPQHLDCTRAHPNAGTTRRLA